ncbi:MAG: 3-dehydroquinate synthase [Chloroflexi bacterium]|nr:3-dehydroquinate synthase [Chloroflexota bacterium]
MSKQLVHRVFLTGFSGTGKSTVAALVAAALGWRAVDSDELIEQAAGRPITEIFERDGEQRFRELEREAIARVATENDVVVATGGGAVVAVENRRTMAAGGLVIALEGRPVTLANRLRDDGDAPASARPLLAGADPVNRIAELKTQRQRFYALADALVETDYRTAEEVAAAVTERVRAADAWFSDHPDRLLTPEERDGPHPDEPIWVEAASRRYPVYVGWGLLDRLGELLEQAGLAGTVHVISDPEVMSRHGDRAVASLRRAEFQAYPFATDAAGEEVKTLETASLVYDVLAQRKAERSHTIVALGGGVIGDLAGFVAATYLRGLPFVQAPTSFLAMVDAAIGGKVAVDHHEGKNLIGAFHQPRLVVADVSVLKTLPRQKLVEGCAEAIKHALILDPALLTDLEEQADDLLHLEPSVTVDIVRRNVAIKAAVVSEDERDTGRRAILNYGHTVGHAIEAAAGYTMGHGAADAIGMTAAAEIGRRLGVTPEAAVKRQRAVLDRFGLPTSRPGLNADAVFAAMALDKKVEAGKLRWVLLEDIGRASVHSDVPEELVRDVVEGVLT